MSSEEKHTVDPTKGVSGDNSMDIKYQDIIDDFGCKLLVDEEKNVNLLKQFEEVTKQKPHHWLRRGLYFSHRDFDIILNLYENNMPFYLYTGRGPSGEMHLGHLVPFLFTKYLQDVFQCPLVIQITDDEKYLLRNDLSIDDIKKFAYDNIVNIISCGFDPERTFIFCDWDYLGNMYECVCKISKLLTLNQIRGCFGFKDNDNIGKWAFPPIQMAPSFNQAFPILLPDIDSFENPGQKKKKKKKAGKIRGLQCLIPCAIDQDPYFRLTRDIANKLKYRKPSTIYSKFFPGLKGPGSKMSTSIPDRAIFLSDSNKKIKQKINKSFSGGGKTKKEQIKNGANLLIDVPYQYLTFFLDDDDKLKEIGEKYSKGEMLTGEIKKELISIIQSYMKEFNDRKKKVTKDVVERFKSIRPLKFKDGLIEKYGIK